MNDWEVNKFIRPNMIVACGLNYKMLDETQIVNIVMTVRQHLLTPRGLRTLSPHNPLYKGTLDGDQASRDIAGKNGTVWIWPLTFYVKTCFDLSRDRFLREAEEIIAGFEEDIQAYCIGSVNEVYDADPPYTPKGSMSQAWSVGAVLEICRMAQEHGMQVGEEPKEEKSAAKKGAKAEAKSRKSSAKRVKKESKK